VNSYSCSRIRDRSFDVHKGIEADVSCCRSRCLNADGAGSERLDDVSANIDSLGRKGGYSRSADLNDVVGHDDIADEVLPPVELHCCIARRRTSKLIARYDDMIKDRARASRPREANGTNGLVFETIAFDQKNGRALRKNTLLRQQITELRAAALVVHDPGAAGAVLDDARNCARPAGVPYVAGYRPVAVIWKIYVLQG